MYGSLPVSGFHFGAFGAWFEADVRGRAPGLRLLPRVTHGGSFILILRRNQEGKDLRASLGPLGENSVRRKLLSHP